MRKAKLYFLHSINKLTVKSSVQRVIGMRRRIPVLFTTLGKQRGFNSPRRQPSTPCARARMLKVRPQNLARLKGTLERASKLPFSTSSKGSPRPSTAKGEIFQAEPRGKKSREPAIHVSQNLPEPIPGKNPGPPRRDSSAPKGKGFIHENSAVLIVDLKTTQGEGGGKGTIKPEVGGRHKRR